MSMSCSGCPYLHICRATKIRHCDGRRHREGTSNSKSLRELASSRLTIQSFKRELVSWDNNHFISQVRNPYRLTEDRKMALLEECQRRGIRPPVWLLR